MNYRTKASLFRFGLYAFFVDSRFFLPVPSSLDDHHLLQAGRESITGFNALRIHTPTLANYKRLFELIPIWRNLYNSAFTAVVGTATTLFFCSLAGYAFAKYRFPGRNALFYFVVGTMMISTEVGAVPLFVLMRRLGLVNSLWSLIIPAWPRPLGHILFAPVHAGCAR